ncbi:MAG: response regulator [Syntrophobacteraceae bacterium]|jgi:DNA-binding NtrC family response regulator|nr:response regulator [Syntrophobacteraceae bacterium]
MEKDCSEAIFVVDDDRGILDSFDAMLGDDYPLVMVDNGAKALTLLSEYQPRLMFLDIKMPGMNGLDLLQCIRNNRMSTQVVIVTALPQEQYEELAHQYGVYRYLKKPLDVDEVEDITRTVLH